jgi:hypothetical protein
LRYSPDPRNEEHREGELLTAVPRRPPLLEGKKLATKNRIAGVTTSSTPPSGDPDDPTMNRLRSGDPPSSRCRGSRRKRRDPTDPELAKWATKLFQKKRPSPYCSGRKETAHRCFLCIYASTFASRCQASRLVATSLPVSIWLADSPRFGKF